MSKVLKVKNEIKEAMKTKNKVRLEALRMLLSALQKKQIELKISEVDYLTDAQLEDVVVKELKMLEQEKESLINAKRDTEKVETQIEVLNEFAPVYMSEVELNGYISEKIIELGITSIKEKGKLMGVISKELKGKADLSKVNGMISSILS